MKPQQSTQKYHLGSVHTAVDRYSVGFNTHFFVDWLTHYFSLRKAFLPHPQLAITAVNVADLSSLL